MRWSVDQVLAVAPDPPSIAAGRTQAAATRWTGLGASDAAVWGACGGSGKNPYLTCVQLAEPAFRCSCPSRKFPCKHALGLLLLWTEGAVPAGEEPEWVRGWLAERALRGRRGAERPEAPRDPEAAARRAEQRAERVAAGAAELREWLVDRVRGGLAGVDVEELYGVAARMVDAQAPGLAGGLRRAAGLIGRGRDWPGRLLTELALLHVLAEASTRLPTLPADLAATVRSRLGFPTDTADVLASGERVADEWLVAAVTDEVTERLTTRRTWLRGQATRRPALVLAFAPPGQPLPRTFPAGHTVRGELAFYPGAAPLRALVADVSEPVRSGRPAGDSVLAALHSFPEALAVDPWLERWPVVLADVAPVADGEGWALVDPEGAALPLAERVDPWPLLAVSAGAPVTVAGEWNAAGLRPLTCWDGDRVVRL
ncbi:SWIM zinc finger family protein [Pseudonocardia sp. DSM 110487]|uniref:SWIM zinc finger family protein n=1 Tax=Pseudonocardia sp. DSM 110487 TaxID=2865833 RepID=UPI0021046705|nr:SWIM zinc finger family protein [Pseudonocardia sp. DSM 110487]